MSETNPPRVKVAIFLPPVAQYAKGDGAFFEGETAEEVEALLDAALEGNLFEKAALAAKTYLTASGLLNDSPAPSGQQNTASAQTADNVTSIESKFCDHGKRNYRTGTNKQGKAYAGWFCPAKGNNECKPIWAD